MAKGSTLKFISTAAAGAIIGALAVRALDKYILKKEEGDEGRQLPGADQQQQYATPFASPIMPVFLPTMPMTMPMPPPMVPPPPPSMMPPASVSEDEVSIVDEIEAEWD